MTNRKPVTPTSCGQGVIEARSGWCASHVFHDEPWRARGSPRVRLRTAAPITTRRGDRWGGKAASVRKAHEGGKVFCCCYFVARRGPGEPSSSRRCDARGDATRRGLRGRTGARDMVGERLSAPPLVSPEGRKRNCRAGRLNDREASIRASPASHHRGRAGDRERGGGARGGDDDA